MEFETAPKIKTKKIPGAKDYWKRDRRGKPLTIVANPQDLSIDEFPPPGFNRNELTTTRPLQIIRRGNVGNYNADKTVRDD